MTDKTIPTCEELFDGDGFKSVHREADTSWRHGAYITQVFHREADGTYWEANYRLSTDGETNELREGSAEIREVVPVEKTVIVYRSAQSATPTA